jgi:hypothetical protein
MTPTVTIQELALALTAKNYSPTLLNSDFLKYSGIVPPDWELARPPFLVLKSLKLPSPTASTLLLNRTPSPSSKP